MGQSIIIDRTRTQLPLYLFPAIRLGEFQAKAQLQSLLYLAGLPTCLTIAIQIPLFFRAKCGGYRSSIAETVVAEHQLEFRDIP